MQQVHAELELRCCHTACVCVFPHSVCVCVCVFGNVCVCAGPLFPGMSCEEDSDLQSWGWTDLCVNSPPSSCVCVCVSYVGQVVSVSDKQRGLCCNQTDSRLLLFVDV